MDTDQLRRQQGAFARAIRHPEEACDFQGVEAGRMAVYQSLFFNNLEGFLAGGFPVVKSLLTEDAWTRLVRDYLAGHAAKTPLFIEISAEFVTFLKTEWRPSFATFPALPDLAHYEWMELALATREAEPPAWVADFLQQSSPAIPRLSPVAEVCWYDYPVHRLGPHSPEHDVVPEGVPLLIYRGRDESVHFVELNLVTARLLESLKGPGELLPLLEDLAETIGHQDPQAVVRYGLDLLQDLHQKGVVGP